MCELVKVDARRGHNLAPFKRCVTREFVNNPDADISEPLVRTKGTSKSVHTIFSAAGVGAHAMILHNIEDFPRWVVKCREIEPHCSCSD